MKNSHRPPRHVPPYVTACQEEAWTILTWRKDAPGKQTARCFRCRSWRHPGPCRVWKNRQDFARILAGLKKHEDWLYMVLTFRPDNSPTRFDTYRQSGKFWNRLRASMLKRFGDSAYVGTVEAHVTSRRAHYNVAIHNGRMLAYCQVTGCPHEEIVPCSMKATGQPCTRRYCRNCRGRGYRLRLCAGYRKLRRELHLLAVKAGFGDKHFWLEPVRSREGIAGYLVKLSDSLVDTDGGVPAAGHDQTPIEAPPYFRRLRPSQGLLPPRQKNPEITGVLVHKPVEVVAAEMVAQGDQKGSRSVAAHPDGPGKPAAPGLELHGPPATPLPGFPPGPHPEAKDGTAGSPPPSHGDASSKEHSSGDGDGLTEDVRVGAADASHDKEEVPMMPTRAPEDKAPACGSLAGSSQGAVPPPADVAGGAVGPAGAPSAEPDPILKRWDAAMAQHWPAAPAEPVDSKFRALQQMLEKARTTRLRTPPEFFEWAVRSWAGLTRYWPHLRVVEQTPTLRAFRVVWMEVWDEFWRDWWRERDREEARLREEEEHEAKEERWRKGEESRRLKAEARRRLGIPARKQLTPEEYLALFDEVARLRAEADKQGDAGEAGKQ